MVRHSSRQPRGLLLCVVLVTALSMLALALPSAGRAIVNIEGHTPQALPDYDSRASVEPTADQLAAANALGVNVDWNRFGVASSVSNTGNYVTKGLQAPNAVSAARKWLDANKTLFKLDSTDSLAAVTTQPFTGTTNDYAIVFRQVVDGVASTDGAATVALVGSKDAGWNVTYASSSLTGGSTDATGSADLTPGVAWTEAANNVGVDTSVVDIAAQSTTAGTTTLAVRGLAQTQQVKKAVFATPHHGARAAYNANVTTNADGNLQSYQVVVDAETGDVLYRANQVDHIADNPTWKAPGHSRPYNPLNAFPWNYPMTDDRDRASAGRRRPGCASVKGDDPATNTYPGGVASKQPWDVQATSAGFTGTANTTWGNNVDDARVWSNAHDPHGSANYGSPTLTRATSATRDYQPAFTDAWYTSGCDPNKVNAAINPPGNDIEASTVSLFVGHNVMHDWAYYLGFDEGHWNAQQYNNGVTVNDPSPTPGGPTIAAPLGNDGLLGNAQSGAATGSRDNANMGTGADGLHPTTNQFLWQPLAGSFYAPCVDGAYDFSVFGHEYGHLIENRMIGKGVGARQGNAAGAMGEAFGDFDALAAFNELHLPVPAGADRYTEGAYATGNGYNGIRDFLAGRPMGGEFPEPGKNPDTDPLNYGNFGFDIVGTEVHADGEIWVAVQMDLRDLFLGRNPSPGAATDIACAHGQILPQNCPGDRQWIQDYYDAMVLMPRNTTMIQARDAMLAADLGRFGGANMDLLWQGFAMRGFGLHQSTLSNADANPVPDFSMPATTGRATRCSCRQRDAELLRRDGQGQGRRPGQREDLRRRLRGALDAGRRHRSGDGQRRNRCHRQSRQHGAVRADGAGARLAPPQGQGEGTLVDVQLRRRRTGLRTRPLQLEGPEAGRGPQRHDQHADELRVGGAGRDDHDRRSHDHPARHRDEREPAEPDRRRRGHGQHAELHADRHLPRAGERPLGRDQARAMPRPSRRRSSGSASRRCSAAGSSGSARSTRTRAPRARTRTTRPATARSTPVGRRSSPGRPTRSRAPTRGRGRRTRACATSTRSRRRRRRT